MKAGRRRLRQSSTTRSIEGTSDTQSLTALAADTQWPVNVTLTVDLQGSGSGSVTSVPAGLTCSGARVSCAASFRVTSVTLTATPDAGMVFTGWSGACSGSASCRVTTDATRLVVAGFTAPPQFATWHYHLDALGSVRAVTDASGALLERHDYFAFGQEYLAPASTDPRRYTAKEHDDETALDYFGARYLNSVTGRFTAIDPIDIGQLELLEPQRMNRYASVLNSPVTFSDPDGRDAILVDVSEGGKVFGLSFGHEALIAVSADGSLTISQFGPVGQGGISVPGVATTVELKERLQFDANHLATHESLIKLAAELAKTRGESPQSVRLAYFKTNAKDTAALLSWMNKNNGQRFMYHVSGNNCGNYCRRGLAIADIIPSDSGGLSLPNADFWFFSYLADESIPSIPPTASVATSTIIILPSISK